MDYSKPYLGKIVKIVIDRPMGSKHPKHGYVYPVNYGFVEGTKAPDGAELDAYIIGQTKALKDFRGRCVAIIHRLEDDDDKLVVCSDGQEYTDDQIVQAVKFQEQWFKSQIIRD